MDPADELIIIVDEENRPVGTATRGEMRRRRLIHRATYILVFNSCGEIFVQKRSAVKDIYPGWYCVATGGVVAEGESYEESAARELAEELGALEVPLTPLFDFFHQEPANRVWGRAYCCRYDGPIQLQAEEIDNGSFLPVEEVFRRAASEPFTPDGLHVLSRFTCQGTGEAARELFPC